jgi:hypothetical protein
MGRIEERINFCDGHSLFDIADLHDFVAGAHLALLQNAKVESRPSAGCQQCRHPRLVHSNADPIAGHARLCDLEHGAADLITIANANAIVGQSFDREILAELSVDEVGPLELLPPEAIRLYLIDEDGSLLTTVTGQVALTISVQIQPPDPTAAAYRSLPYPGVDGTTLPRDVARKSDIHR